MIIALDGFGLEFDSSEIDRLDEGKCGGILKAADGKRKSLARWHSQLMFIKNVDWPTNDIGSNRFNLK